MEMDVPLSAEMMRSSSFTSKLQCESQTIVLQLAHWNTEEAQSAIQLVKQTTPHKVWFVCYSSVDIVDLMMIS